MSAADMAVRMEALLSDEPSRKVAARLGVHYKTVLRWRQGHKEATASRKWRCCNRLYVNTPSCAVCGRDEPHQPQE